jgi:hypothetical protein
MVTAGARELLAFRSRTAIILSSENVVNTTHVNSQCLAGGELSNTFCTFHRANVRMNFKVIGQRRLGIEVLSTLRTLVFRAVGLPMTFHAIFVTHAVPTGLANEMWT